VDFVAERKLRRKMFLSLAVLLFSLSLFVFSSFAWFTGKFEAWINAEVGFVEVEMEAFFDDGVGDPIPAQEVETINGIKKPGVYEINIISNQSDDFFEHFRLYFNVKSNIDTYFRVKIYEQLTLKIENYDGTITELSVLIDGYMPFYYETENWYYDNRNTDDYIYYTEKVQRGSGGEPTPIGMITAYFPEEDFSVYAIGYSLQLAISIEAVQAEGGPEENWGLTETPWGTSW